MTIGGTPRHLEIEAFYHGISSTRRKLQTAVEVMTERLEDLSGMQEEAAAAAEVLPNSNIFLVHGHDDPAREEVARFITRAGLNPIILHEQASGGRTVIEKLEHYSDVGFAVVLLTPDDEGGPAGGPLQSRARQNVIAELFYFLGKLGRSRVCALRKGDVEIPSDVGGVIYVPVDPHGGWKTALLRELEDAGYNLDWGSALR
jgi:predicted nucleotide-binding protein